MRIAIFLLLVGFLQTQATDSYSQNTKLSISVSNTELVKVLDKIENQSEFYFLYNEKLIDANRKVSIEAKEEGIEDVLKNLFSGTDVEYSIIDRKIILAPAYLSESQQPNKKINGKVTDQTGASLPGVSVVIKGTNSGVATNDKGEFTLQANTGETLIFSFIGYVNQEVAVGRNTTLNILLAEDVQRLDDVVIVAYGTSQKSTLTSSVSAIKGNTLVDAPVASIPNNLAGRAAGVLTYQTSGEPGSDATTVRIRGQNTFGNSEPLVIIDGIPGQMSDISPQNVENMSILKDAAAVAPYGLAAANGVILITTKKGLKESAIFSYDANYGIQNPVQLAKTINSYQNALIQNETYKNDHPGDLKVPWSAEQLEEYRKVCTGDPTGNYDKYFNSNNARDVIAHNYIMNNQNLSVRGGSKNVIYYASLGYLNQQSMIPTQIFEKYNGVLNVEADISNTLKVSISAKMSSSINKAPSFNNYITSEFGIYQGLYLTSPMEPIWYPNSGGKWANGAFGYNPIGRIYTSGQSLTKTNRSLYTIGIEKQLPIKGLSIKGIFNYGYDSDFGSDWNTDPIYYTVDNTKSPAVYSQAGNASKPQFTQRYGRYESITAQGFINYTNTFGKHVVSGLFVSELRDLNNENFWAGRKNYSIPIHTLDMGSSSQTDLSNGGSASKSRSIGLVLKLSYAYENKYLVDLSGRYDAHYYFSPGHRSGTFPAVSLGWRLGQEKFIKDNYSWINELKIRASWGESGNLAGGPFQYLSSFASYGEAYRLGGRLGQGLYEQSPPNTNITWEKQKQTDIGIDLNLWNSLLTFTFDYFYQLRDNMLLAPNNILPAEYGIGLPQVNAGKMSNKGIEFSAGTKHVFENGINFYANANFSFARNKQLEIFENLATYDSPNRRRTGTSMNSMWGLRAMGYFQSQEEIDNSPKQKFGFYTIGDVKYEDVNGDGVVDGTDETIIGLPNFPECIIGLDLGSNWKGFDVSTLIQGATLCDVYAPGPVGGALPGSNAGNATQIEALDHWTPETPNAQFPRYSNLSSSNNYQGSTLRVRDGTYIRLKNFSLGYTPPNDLVNKILKIESLRIYLSGQNMLTWTAKNLNSDPESAAGNRYRFANQKVMSVGVNLKF